MREISYDEQLDEWVKGNSIHSGTKDEGRCCPDFSCCKPENLQPIEIRKDFSLLFRTKGEQAIMPYLMQFMGEMINSHYGDDEEAPKVYIAGGEPQLEN